METFNTTINIRDQDGKLFPLNEKLKRFFPALFQPSMVNELAVPSGQGFYSGWIAKQTKRFQIQGVNSKGEALVAPFAVMRPQNVHRVFIDKYEWQDNIPIAYTDVVKFREATGGDNLVQEAGNFIIAGQENDLLELYKMGITKAGACKLFTAFSQLYAPLGAQPSQTDFDKSGALKAIRGGKRVVDVADFEEDATTRIELIRATVQYLNTIGIGTSTEIYYAYALNGISTAEIGIAGTYEALVKIKDGVTSNFINVTNPGDPRTLNGVVGFIDGIKTYMTNTTGVEYVIQTKRHFIRDLDPNKQYIGVIRDAAAAVQSDNTFVNLSPETRLLQFQQGRSYGVGYEHEAFYLRRK